MIHKDSFAKLLDFLNVLQARAGTRTRLCLGAASVAVLTIILRRLTAKHTLITDYTKVATKVNDEEFEFDEWDFIIVGGGTAGCVLASRLSEDPYLRVLLIEAGGSSKKVLDSRIPSAFLRLFRTPFDYEFYTEPQQHAGNKKKYWPRAKLLGGCTTMNAMMAQYGAPSDFDEWAKIAGDESWSWDNFSKYFRKFEKYIPNRRFPRVDPLLRGANGPVGIGYNAYTWPGSEAFIQACVNIGIPFSPDFCTTKGTKGTNKIMTYIDSKSTRVTTEAAYLTDEVLARPNLKVVTCARVTKVLFDTSSGIPRATGVEFASESHVGKGPKCRAQATKEVIVSGGAIHSPQILMLSGVGPAEQLSRHNIPLVLDVPAVGTNLMDHPTCPLRLKETTGMTFNHLTPYDLRTRCLFMRDFLRYQLWGTGPIASNVGEAVAFFRSDDHALELYSPKPRDGPVEDPTSGPDAPDLEIIVCPAAVREHNILIGQDLYAYQMLVVLLRPTSKGSLFLKSADPLDHPVINPNYLETWHDIDVFVRGLRAAIRIAHTAPMSAVTDVGNTHPQLDHHFSLLSDEQLADIVRDRVETLYHPVGTCSMGPEGVVDSNLCVKGIQGLRVCDASVFPKLVSGHTTGAVIATAEKLADVIKAHYFVNRRSA